MNIKEFLSSADVLVDVSAPTKVLLLQELAQRASAALNISDGLILSALLKREELGSTGTGGGIAIPHARVLGLDRPFGVMARLKQPLDFDAIDGQPVDLLFLLLLPAASNQKQLNALASIARILRNPESVRNLRRARDSTDLFNLTMTLG